MRNYTQSHTKGFTILELLVSIAIIGMLMSVVLVGLNQVRSNSRDGQRKAEMMQVQAALEMYKLDYGRYPITSTWSGFQKTGCGLTGGTRSGATGYIPNLAPTYLAILPLESRANAGDCSGYLYYSDGQSYKFLNHNVGPESFPAAGQPFHDPVRPTWSWMVCSGASACTTW